MRRITDFPTDDAVHTNVSRFYCAAKMAHRARHARATRYFRDCSNRLLVCTSTSSIYGPEPPPPTQLNAVPVWVRRADQRSPTSSSA